jgi:AraC family transcriptional regulator of adaptative response / DNA-3-methyladenine glycosylase II
LILEASLRPRGPYSLALTARLAGDATRTFRDGVFDAVLPGAEGPERVLAWQQPDGTVSVRAGSMEAVERLRFVLALDDDHGEFLRRFDRDPLLREAAWHLRGLRQIRVATVAHALLRAFCGQLIESKLARDLERKIVRAVTPPSPPELGWLRRPPTRADLGALAPAALRGLGLHERRGAALVRLCRTLDLERLHALPTAAAAARLERERGLGPWSVGLVCLEGLGRREVGLVGDLGLIKLCSALRGGRAEAAETAELLEPYGEWAGLASLYFLAGFGRGLIPLPDGSRVRKPRRAA